MWIEILRKLGMKLLSSLLTWNFLKKLVLFLLQKLAERTDNSIDDEVVEMVRKALEEEPEKPKA